jgi:hypothetical protein
VSAYAEARPAPLAELRTSLGLATLGAALCHVMAAAHVTTGVWPAALPNLGIALLQCAIAAGVAFTAARWIIGPAAAINAVIALVWIATHVAQLPIGLPELLATVGETVAAGGASALLLGCGDRALSVWSKAALLVFAATAMTGFGHAHHG